MKRLIIALTLASAYYLHAAGVKAGKERLRELVVFPKLDLTLSYKIQAQTEEFIDDSELPGEIAKLRKQASDHPDDPEILLKLGTFLSRSGATNESKEVAMQLEKAARKKVEARPQDGSAVSCLAIALDILGREQEAEGYYRKATQVSSNDWKCWVRMGTAFGSRAFYSLVPKDNSKPLPDSFQSIFAAAEQFQPSPDVLAKSEAMRKESVQCFERAIKLAPKEPDVYLGRANVQGALGMADLLDRFYRDKHPLTAQEALEANCSPQAVEDSAKAAQLCPDDDRIIATAAWIKLTFSLAKAAQQHPGVEPALDDLPEKTQSDIHGALAKLELLSQTPDKTRSASALENLGGLKWILRDTAGAKTALRRAVALEPAREKAWEWLLGASVSSDTPPGELVGICESLVKCHNSARNHIFLAKALVKANRLDDAKKELQTAEDIEPGNVLTRLFAFALSLKLSGDETYLVSANAQVRWVDDLLEKMPDGEEKRTRLRELLLDAAIFNGLVDKPDSAKECIDKVLKGFPDDETAKEIRSALQ